MTAIGNVSIIPRLSTIADRTHAPALEIIDTHVDNVVLWTVRVRAANIYPATVADGLDHSNVVSAIEILYNKQKTIVEKLTSKHAR